MDVSQINDSVHQKLLKAIADYDLNNSRGEAIDSASSADSAGPSEQDINLVGNPVMGPDAPMAAAPMAKQPTVAPGASPQAMQPPPPKVNLDTPLGYRPPTPPPAKPVDTELADAQREAANRRAIGQVGQAISNAGERQNVSFANAMRLGGGGPGPQGPRSEYWKDYGAEGDRAVSDLMERRKSEAGMAQAQSAAAKAAEDRDPNSSQAQFARDFIYNQAPELKGKLDGKSIHDMSVAFPWIPKVIEENVTGIKTKAAADAKALDEANKAEAKRKEVEADKGALGELHPELAGDINKLQSSEAAKLYGTGVEGRKARDQSSKNSINATAISQGRERGFKLDDKAAAEAEKRAQMNIQEWPITDKSPTLEPATLKAIKDDKEGVDLSLDLINRQKELVSKYGRKLIVPLTDEDRLAQSQSNSIAQQLADQASKASVNANRLPNQAAFEKFNNYIIGVPSKISLSAMLVGDKLQIAPLEEYERTLLKKKELLKRSYTGEQVDGSQTGGKSSPGAGYVRGKVDGHPGWVNQETNDFKAD